MKSDVNIELQRRNRRGQAHPGAALIMVLALLSILIVLAIGFSASMRTEQQASGNYEATARGRGLVPTAIRQAMGDIEREHYDAEVPYYYAQTRLDANDVSTLSDPPAMKIYPNADICYSKGTAIDDFVRTKMLRSGSQFDEDWLPDLYRASFRSIVDGGDVQWEPLVTNEGKGVLIELPQGRYFYVALNVSDFFDPSYLIEPHRPGGSAVASISTPRIPGELSIEDSGGRWMSNQMRVVDFLSGGATLGSGVPSRFYSYGEMHYYMQTTTSGSEPQAFKTDASIMAYPGGFYPPRAYNVADNKMIDASTVSYIGGDGTDWATEAEITASLAECGLSSSQATIAYNALVDFVDADSTPQNVASDLGVENNPLFNEAVFTCTVTKVDKGGGEYTYTVNVEAEVEFFHPFDQDFDSDRAWEASFEFEDDAGLMTAPLTVSFTNPSDLPQGMPDFLSYTTSGSVSFDSSENEPDLTLGVKADVKVVDGGDDVDLVTGEITGHLVVTTDGAQNVYAVQCIDPRFNFDFGNTAMWSPRAEGAANGDPGAMNQAALAFMNDGSNLADGPFTGGAHTGDFTMHVANEPLYVVGDLGAIPIAPWRTVRLIYDGDHPNANNLPNPVCNYFTVDAPGVGRTKFNINTQVSERLKPAFARIPVSSSSVNGASAPPGSYVINYFRAGVLADRVIGAGPFINKAELMMVPNLLPKNVGITTSSDLENESIMRNLLEHVDTRQNLFVMMVCVQPLRDEAFRKISTNPGLFNITKDIDFEGTQYAAALVWRDPFIDGPAHRVHVRRLAYLYE